MAKRIRRRRPPLEYDDNGQIGRAGIPVDFMGRDTIDPTKNVGDLVEALKDTLAQLRSADAKRLDDLREAETRFQNFAREASDKLHKLALDAETSRIDQLAKQAIMFSDTIRNMLAESVRTTSDLVADALKEMRNTFNDRVSKLEAGAFVAAGKSSVADPALADALTRMTNTMATMRQDQIDAIAKLSTTLATIGTSESVTKGRGMGRGEVFAWLCAAVVAGGSVATFVGILVRAAISH
jgi:hypothetical protein